MTTGPGASDFLTALGLVLVFEGLAYAVMPGTMKRFFETARLLDEGAFRLAGLVALVLGVAVVWLVRG
mgnify:CR=1 FL=1